MTCADCNTTLLTSELEQGMTTCVDCQVELVTYNDSAWAQEQSLADLRGTGDVPYYEGVRATQDESIHREELMHMNQIARCLGCNNVVEDPTHCPTCGTNSLEEAWLEAHADRLLTPAEREAQDLYIHAMTIAAARARA